MACALMASTMLPSTVQAEGTVVWNSIGYATPNGSDSLVLNPDSRNAPTQAAHSWAAPPYAVRARSGAGFGSIDASASATSSRSGNLGHFINSVFADELTLSRPDLAGQAGQITLTFYHENRLAPSASGDGQANTYADWYAWANEANGSVNERFNVAGWAPGQSKYTYIDDAHGIRQGPTAMDDQYLTLTADFTWGEPVLFGYGLATSGQAVENGSYEVEVAGYWGGIVEATAAGAVIDDYMLTSRTGIDYSRSFVPAVPEPAALALLAAGLLPLGWRGVARAAARRRP